tara:strand:+ start:23 stop:1162 length:1140 start_codon:yes stop_codon:yes gene_type:complete
MVEFYNQELDRFHTAHPNITANVSSTSKVVKEFVNLDKTKFSWDSTDFKRIATSEKYEVPTRYWTGTYRPFFKQHVTFDKKLNSRVYQLPRIFPEPEHQTLAICVTPPGSMAPPFSALMVDGLADLGIFWGGTQILPLLIEPVPAAARGPATLLDEIDPSAEAASSNISTDTLTRYREWDSSITDRDIFFYTYGVLYSSEYRSQFAKDLKKSLPRIPEPPSADIFWNFSSAGEQLSDIHVGYESQPTYEDLNIEYADGFDDADRALFRVTKMKYPKISNPHDPEKTISDLSTIVFNSAIRITNIPIEAHEFRIGSRSAIDWIVNKYQVGTDRSSGILNDPNDWAEEHDDPTYIFDLLRRIVTVSMKTNEIVAGLPKLKF